MTEEARQANERGKDWLNIRALRKQGAEKYGLWLQRLSRENDHIGYAKVASQEDLSNAISDMLRKVVDQRAIQDPRIDARSQGRMTILTRVHGVEIGGEDLPQTDWQKSVEAFVQDESYSNDMSSCDELDRQFEEE